jgi:uncharacterized membrane protein YccC
VAVAGWLRRHDRGFAALRRAGRTAIVMPALFALGVKVIGNPMVATFAAFGSFAMLLLVDFGGAMWDRVRNQAALAIACGGLIAIATLASRSTWAAALAMTVVAFGVLFIGVASSVLAGATQTLLLSFILPVSLAAPASSIPDRLAGWGMASACSLLAIALLWPAPEQDPVRSRAIASCRALASRMRAEIAMRTSPADAVARQSYADAVAASDKAVRELHDTFFATPFRPTGLSTSARAVVRLVDELRWLHATLPASVDAPHPARRVRPDVRRVKDLAARVLDDVADLLERPSSTAVRLRATLGELDVARGQLERSTMTLPERDAEAVRADVDGIVTALDPSFRAHELTFVVSAIGANAAAAAAAENRTWVQRRIGRRPAGFPSALTAVQERAGAHLERHSLWLRNSVRGAVGLGLAVLVSQLIGVQHAFWVVLGALSVLRSSALNTGQSVARAIGGTVVGFVVGGALVALVGTNQTVLWALLPVAILLAGLAPAAVSFGAGQAAFTLTILIIFNILQPVGWKLGLVRIEDVALGCAVSLAVGLLLWPRGAGAALGRALSEAYRDSAAYLAGAVAHGVALCDSGAQAAPEPTGDAIRAAASARRLDDTFRGYLGERGTKPVPLAEVTSLVTGVTGLRLAADAVLELWRGDGAAGGERRAARRELVAGTERMTGWYGDLAASLTGRGTVPSPRDRDDVADRRLIAAVSRDLRDRDGRGTATAVRVIWTGDHLDAVRRLEGMLFEPARAAVETHALQ